MFDIEYANIGCFEYLKDKDKHIATDMLFNKINAGEIIIIMDGNDIIGWLRYGYFWDSIPFMNMLMIDQQYRGKGLGKSLVTFWENEMKKKGYKLVLTSTLSNESPQHFYRKLGYKDSGALFLEDEGLEIVFKKELD